MVYSTEYRAIQSISAPNGYHRVNTAKTDSDVTNGMTLLCPLLTVRHMGFDVIIETCHTTIIRPPFKCSFPLEEDNKNNEDAVFCIQGPCLLLDLYTFFVIVVADALFTMFTIVMSCTKEKETFTNICIRKTNVCS